MQMRFFMHLPTAVALISTAVFGFGGLVLCLWNAAVKGSISYEVVLVNVVICILVSAGFWLVPIVRSNHGGMFSAGAVALVMQCVLFVIFAGVLLEQFEAWRVMGSSAVPAIVFAIAGLLTTTYSCACTVSALSIADRDAGDPDHTTLFQ
jgi:hypothetical protein